MVRNYIIVNKTGDALWTRSTQSCSAPWLMETLHRLRRTQAPHDTAYLCEGPADTPTVVAQLRLAEPFVAHQCEVKDAGAYTAELWHYDNFPNIPIEEHLGDEPPTSIDANRFTRVGEFVVSYSERPEESLERIYALSQNVDHPWRPGSPVRSTSVSDVVVLRLPCGEEAWRVMPTGFKRLRQQFAPSRR